MRNENEILYFLTLKKILLYVCEYSQIMHGDENKRQKEEKNEMESNRFQVNNASIRFLK